MGLPAVITTDQGKEFKNLLNEEGPFVITASLGKGLFKLEGMSSKQVSKFKASSIHGISNPKSCIFHVNICQFHLCSN